MRFELGCAAVITAFIFAAGFDQRASDTNIKAREIHKRNETRCPKVPCLEVPAACFMHGGAPQAPECLRD